MANYYLNDNGTTSVRKQGKGKNYILQDDGNVIENRIANNIAKKKKKKKEEEDKSFLDQAGDFGISALKTVGNFATNMGEGALRTLEGGLDFFNSASDFVNNSLLEKAEVITGKSTKKEAKKHRKEREKDQREFISRDLTNEFQEAVGFNDIKKDWEKDSLIKSDNLGGQISQGIGGMVPSLVVGNLSGKALGATNSLASTSTKGLSLGKKLITTGKNIGKAAIKNAPANTVLTTSSYGQALQEAYQNGATDEEARNYALGSSATELATEWVTGGIPGIESTGFLDKAANKLINKATGKISNKLAKEITKTVLNAGYEAVGEGLEEGISEIVSPLLKNATYSENEKVNWNDVFSSVIVGGITGGILNAPATVSNFRNNVSEIRNASKNESKTKATLPTGLNQNLNNNSQEFNGNPLINNNRVSMPLDSNTVNRLNNQNNAFNQSLENESISTNTNTLPVGKNELNSQNSEKISNINPSIVNDDSVAYEYVPDSNTKIDNLRKSANQYLNNSNTSKSFIETAEKVINDKGYNIILDNNLTAANGNMVNAQIKTLENGETEIRINPNSDRAGEFLLTHEIMHAIETKDMVDLVTDYASKNKEFNSALESLKGTYGTNEVSSEVLADISGQLFGNEEFINTLSVQKPNIFKRIYNKIVSLANKITGNSKESLFIRDLKAKWEKAYRNNNNKFSKTEYMMTGIKGTKNAIKNDANNSWLESNYKKASEKINNGEPNDKVRQETGWFKGKDGKLRFEISDNEANIISPEKNKSYKLGEFLSHEDLYEMYPKLRNSKIKFKDIKPLDNHIVAGQYNTITNTIEINNTLLNMSDSITKIKKTLLHEIQHNIQKIEKFSMGSTGKKGMDEYRNNIGEIEARDTENRIDLNELERLKSKPNIALDDKKSIEINKSKSYNRYKETLNEKNFRNSKKLLEETLRDNERSTRLDGTSRRQGELDNNSSFSFDENAKRYDDLKKTNNIEFFKKDNGDIRINMIDSNNNLVNQFDIISKNNAIKSLGENIANYIYNQASTDVKTISLNTNSQAAKDSDGTILSPQQNNYFKNSKARDEDGNLKVLYHGTPNNFTRFNYDFIGSNGTALGKGFYLTDNEELAEGFSGKTGKVMKLYANITKPMSLDKVSISKSDYKKFILAVDKKTNGQFLSDYGDVKYEGYNDVLDRALDNYGYSDNDVDLIHDVLNTASLNWEDGFRLLKNTLGYDGVIKKYNYNDKDNTANIEDTVYVPVLPEQIKNVDNLNPTDNEDIRYSKENGEWKNFVENNFKSKGTKSYFKDMKLKESKNIEQDLRNKEIKKIQSKNNKLKKSKQKIMTKEASKILQFSDYQTKQKFQNLISEYYDNPDYNKIRKDILENFSEQKIEYVNDELNEIKRNIRSTDLKVDDYVKKNLTDYSFFRKSNFNKLKLKNEGQSIDSFYTELSDMYPSIFSKDITNEVDQLHRLSEFMNEDNTLVEKYKLDDKAIDEATKYIYDSLKDNVNIDDIINSINISPKEIRREKTNQYREEAEDFVKDSFNWKDKKSGLAYKINTMKRNFYDIMPKKDAERLYTNYVEPIFNHNAAMQKDIETYNKRIEKLKLNDKESTAVQMLGEYKYNPETLLTGSQIDEFISKNKLDYDKISNAVEEFRGLYDELYDRVNAVLKSQGYKEVDYRKGYFPHFIDDKPTSIVGKLAEKLGWKFKNNDLPTSIAGITDQFKPGKVWTSFSQQRKGKITDYNALKGFDNYIRGAMQDIYFTEDIQKLRALENEIRYQHSDKGVQSKIDEIYDDTSLSFEDRQDKIEKIYATYITPLNNFVTELRDYTNGIANKKSGLDRTVEALSNRKFYNVMENVSSRLSANMVGMNLGSAITNFIPITQAASQVKSKYLLKGLKEAIKNQYSTDGFDNKSVFLTSRLNEADRLYKTKLEKVSEKMNFMFDGIDSITSNTIVRAKYYENKAKGMSEFNAMRNADEFARDLMAGRTKGEMPTAFNSKNPLVKMFTSFQLEVNNQFGYMLKDLPRDLGDETKKKLIGAFVKMFVGAWMYNQLTEKVVGRKASFSPIDTIKEIYDTATNDNLKITDKSADILENLTQDIPFVGGLVGGGRLPISSVANPLNVIKGESTVKDELKKLGYYTILPFGGGQLKKTVEGASLYTNKKEIKGSYTSKGDLRFEAKANPLSVAQNLLFGQYSSKSAREYFAKGYAPIDAKTMKKLQKQNLSVDEYRKYEDNYSSLKTKTGKKINDIKSDKVDGKPVSGSASAKKAYLIMNSNFSKKEKNYMLSKLTSSDKYPKVSDLEKLPNDKKIYKFYYSMNNDSRKEFNKELNNLDISADKLCDYYLTRKKYNNEYVSGFAKSKMMDYIQNSNLNENTKWYLYNKDYGSESLELLKNTFNIKTSDYFNVMKYSEKIKNEYSGEKQSKLRKSMVYQYINNLKISEKQKIILFKQAGYTTSTSKVSMYDYINNLNLSAIEKQEIWDAIY